jgi:hypothetical protein
LRVTRAKCGPTTSLTEYFANFTPRLIGGDEDGGTTLIHSLPPRDCTEPGCSESFDPDYIETRWPKTLQINPDTGGTQPQLDITRAFTVSDETGVSITYELVGTVSFDAERRHYTSKFLIGDTSFNYDDLARRGSLVPAGPAELICIPDRHAVMWTYNRTSTADTVREPAYFATCIHVNHSRPLGNSTKSYQPMTMLSLSFPLFVLHRQTPHLRTPLLHQTPPEAHICLPPSLWMNHLLQRMRVHHSLNCHLQTIGALVAGKLRPGVTGSFDAQNANLATISLAY